MRLREQQAHLRVGLALLDGYQVNAVGLPGGGQVMHLSRWLQVREAVKTLRAVPALEAECGAVIANQLFAEVSGTISAAPERINPIASALGTLLQKGTLLLSAIDASLPEEAPYTMHVRLPRVASLSELLTTARRLEHAFTSPVQRVFGHEVSVGRFDSGSHWIELCLTTALVYNFTKTLLFVAVDYRKRAAMVEMHENFARVTGASADVIDALAKAATKKIDEWLDQSTERVLEETATEVPDRHEAANSVRASIRELSQLLRDHMEVHASLTPPKDAEALPDPLEVRQLIEASAKALPELPPNGK